MSDRNRIYEDFESKRGRQCDESFTCRAVSRRLPPQAVLTSRPNALPRWPVFLLIALIAVAGEIAAFAVASGLRLGTTATGIALAGVVLSAMWPLVRSAI